jgi:hypothetical protein
MSIIGMPSFAMLLVLANITVCLSVDREKHTTDLWWPATLALSPAPLDRPHNVNPDDSSDSTTLPAIAPLQAD